MRTIVEFKDGHTETIEDVGPNVYEGMVSLVDAEDGVVGDDVPVELISRVIFEP